MHGLFDEMVEAALSPPPPEASDALRCACFGLGVGSFESAARELGMEVVYAGLPSDDGYWLSPTIASELPDHDVLVAGMPALDGDPLEQIMRVVRVKRPRCVVMDSPDDHHVEMRKAVTEMDGLGYKTERRRLRSSAFGALEKGVRNVAVATGGVRFHWPFSGAPVAKEPDQVPEAMPVSMARALVYAAIDAMVRERAARNG